MLRSLLAPIFFAVAAVPTSAATYSARPVAPASGRFIARDIVWHCGTDACLGSTDNGRPLTLCQSLAKRTGPIATFLVDGRALAASELDRCNAAARTGQTPALAAQ